MIINLSSPPSSSINSQISDIFAEVQYSCLKDAIQLLLKCGPHAFMAKTDIEKAFRLLPIHPDQYNLLVYKWEGAFYYDRCLPMGARSACQLFEKFSSAIEFMTKEEGVVYITHYLDDFFIVNATHSTCQSDLKKFFTVCEDTNTPLVKHKTLGPSQNLSFVGFEIDTISETVRLPQDKINKCKMSIVWLLDRSKSTLKDLQSLLGLLNFACTVVVPGRAFLQRLYGLTIGVSKPYFYIRITQEAKKDLRLWLTFLESYNGVSLYREELFLSTEVVDLFTDAAQSLGCGAIHGNEWFSVAWPSEWWTRQNITFLEFIPIYLALEVWGPSFRNRCLVLHTDNIALMHVINTQKSKEPLVMHLAGKLSYNPYHVTFLLKQFISKEKQILYLTYFLVCR